MTLFDCGANSRRLVTINSDDLVLLDDNNLPVVLRDKLGLVRQVVIKLILQRVRVYHIGHPTLLVKLFTISHNLHYRRSTAIPKPTQEGTNGCNPKATRWGNKSGPGGSAGPLLLWCEARCKRTNKD